MFSIGFSIFSDSLLTHFFLFFCRFIASFFFLFTSSSLLVFLRGLSPFFIQLFFLLQVHFSLIYLTDLYFYFSTGFLLIFFTLAPFLFLWVRSILFLQSVSIYLFYIGTFLSLWLPPFISYRFFFIKRKTHPRTSFCAADSHTQTFAEAAEAS